MARFIEYIRESGKILSIINAAHDKAKNIETDETGLIEVPEHFQCDPSAYVVSDGKVVKNYEPVDKHAEREHKKEGIAALNALVKEFLFASLFDDEQEISRIKKEAAKILAYL